MQPDHSESHWERDDRFSRDAERERLPPTRDRIELSSLGTLRTHFEAAGIVQPPTGGAK